MPRLQFEPIDSWLAKILCEELEAPVPEEHEDDLGRDAVKQQEDDPWMR